MLKQHCRTLQVERLFRQCRICYFDIVAVFGNNVAGFGNNVERNFVLSTMSKQIEHVQFVSTVSKGRNFTIESFDIVAVCGNKVEHCFDIVAGVDWTGPYFCDRNYPRCFLVTRCSIVTQLLLRSYTFCLR